MRDEPATYQAQLDRLPHPELALAPSGRGVIETYTVLHDRDGAPMRGVIIGRLDDGRRFLANTASARSVLDALETREGIGCAGTVSSADGVNRFDL